MTQMPYQGAIAAIILGLAGSAAMAGDPATGEREWRQCRSCHMIVDNDGTTIQRGGRVGSNLYGIIGRPAGTVDGARYSSLMQEAAAAGLVWTEENFLAYITDPTGFLRRFTGNSGASSTMNFQLRSGAEDLLAYLNSLSE